jgi:REP element-mobilizing transposase RayT
MSYDSLRRGRHSLHQQVYCIITVTRGRHPLFTDITAARSNNRHLYQHGSLWQRAYYDRAARKDEDIRQIARYIRRNASRLN